MTHQFTYIRDLDPYVGLLLIWGQRLSEVANQNFVSNNYQFFQNFWELIITKKNTTWNDWNNMKIQIRLHKEFGRILRFASGSICKYAVIILSSLILKLSGLEMGLHVYDGRDSVVLCINYKQKLSLNNDACRHRITM